MKVMTAVFSYNRGQLLSNCVRSIERFSPETEIVVFDDGSDDEITQRSLEAIRSRGHQVLVNADIASASRGNLYANMNHALELAGERGFPLLHLMQDDLQFVWRDPRLVDDIGALLAACSDAGQVLIHFWKRLSVDLSTVFESVQAYRASRALAAIGVVDVERLSSHGFRFHASESASAAYAAERGLWSYGIPNPVVARVPWPMHARHRAMAGAEKESRAEFLVRPLDAGAIERLKTRSLQTRPFGEDFVVPWGWRCWQPYPTGASYRIWLRSLIAIAVRRRSLAGLIPRRVGDRE